MLTAVIVPMTGTFNMASMIRVGSKATASSIHAAIAMYGANGRARSECASEPNRWTGARNRVLFNQALTLAKLIAAVNSYVLL